MNWNEMTHDPFAEEALPIRQRLAALEATTTRLTQQLENVQRRHDFLQALVDAIPDPVFVKDLHGTYVTINHAFSRVLQKPPSEIIGKNDRALFPPGMARQLRAADQQILATGETQTLEEVGFSTGATRTYLSTKSVRRDEQGHVIGLMGIAHDITDLKRVEETVTSRAKQMEAVRAVSVEITRELDLTTLLGLIIQRAVELVDAAGAGVIVLWDDAAQQLVSQAWYGNLGPWIQHLRLSLGEGLTGFVAQRREGILVNDYQHSQYAVDKLVRYVGPRAVLAEPLLYRDRLLGAISLGNEGTGKPFAEHDRELLSLFGAQAAIAIENAQLFRAVQEQATQLAQAEEGLLQTQKMAAIGTLAGGIAHDFNNILAAILGFTELALFDSPQDSTQQRNLHEVLAAGKRAKELILQILTFSRQTPPHRKPIHLQTLVKEALIMLRASLPSTITIQSHLEPQVGAIMADATQIHQVLMNLCANTEHAMRETGGLLEVILTEVYLSSTASQVHPDLHPGQYARLEVRDTGHGIEPELLGRIFEPFFTTKEVGQGSGMGLAVAHGIVASHGGAITVRSTPGEGTIFVVYLPQILDKDDAASEF